jgi:hypothetical protein
MYTQCKWSPSQAAGALGGDGGGGGAAPSAAVGNSYVDNLGKAGIKEVGTMLVIRVCRHCMQCPICELASGPVAKEEEKRDWFLS